MDLKEEKTLDAEEKNPSTQIKTCSSCHTTKTPLWRGGPSGPKVVIRNNLFCNIFDNFFISKLIISFFQSLCNACGIKYNKKRRQHLGLETARTGKKKKRSSINKSNEIKEILKMRFMALGSEVMLQRTGKLMSKLREEEQAAILLMSLSCGSVSA
ncbi:GATA transcription factor 15-like [Olea europaea subsp. europaea]|uniref:GATA transcription factor 15-like n=1 Tax=Olea europaea subsp. europaea TaxID=158383 RepID=A0A8S0TQI6_OLEEU|nr:GATA transcription factor 15-like [Olea europaea subsp. europaea]